MDGDRTPDERIDDLPSVSLTELRETLPDTIGRVAHGKVRLLQMLDDMLDLEAAAEALEEIANGGELKSAAGFRKELGL